MCGKECAGNLDGLKKAFLLTTAACMDYRRHWIALEEVGERFFESLEYYDTTKWTWLDSSSSSPNAAELGMEAFVSLQKTADAFYTFIESIDQYCSVILKTILTAPEDIQKAVWGRSYSIPEEEVDYEIKQLLWELTPSKTGCSVEEECDFFVAHMEEMWGEPAC